jgi:hypothetical protein
MAGKSAIIIVIVLLGFVQLGTIWTGLMDEFTGREQNVNKV